MAKAGGSIPSWFWPAGVPRRAPVSQQALPRQFARVFKARAGTPALVSARRSFTFGEVEARAAEIAAALAAQDAAAGAVAVCECDPAAAWVLVLGIWVAARPALLLDPSRPAGQLAAAVARAGCAYAVCEDDPGNGDRLPALRRVAATGGAARPPAAGVRPTDAALLLDRGGRILAHAHFGLAGMATALTTFVTDLKECTFVATAAVTAWETWVPVIAGLLHGRGTVFADATTTADAFSPTYTVIDAGAADACIGGAVPRAAVNARYVFVSCGAFDERWRRRLERALDRTVLCLWGTAELGPLVAAHPAWAPVQAHGFPLVNVTLFPVDAATGQVSIVPWGMLDRAEIGAELVAPCLGYQDEAAGEGTRAKIVRTGQWATIDNVGVVTLL